MERLIWVDEYVCRVRDYVYVRVDDNILIQRPNKAHRMNESAIRILDRLFNKEESIVSIVAEFNNNESVISDLVQFFSDLRCLLTHGLPEQYNSPAIEQKTFDYHFSKYPILSEIAVTYRCNLACRFCYAGCNCTKGPTDNDHEPTFEEVKRLLDVIWRDAKVPSVSFTGGEPALRDELPEMVAYARSIGLRVNLITNGTRCDEKMVGRLKEAGLNSVQVSVEGACAETHDLLTRVACSYEKSLRAVQNFQQVGITVHTNTTLNKLNIEEAEELPALARRLGLERLSMNMMIPAGSGSVDSSLVIPYSKIGAHVERIHAAARSAGVEFMWYSPTPLCLFNPIARGLGNKGCAACDGLLSIAPDGSVLPCSSYDESVGNLLKQSFEEIWFGEHARFFREKLAAPEECKGCESFAACQGACPLYWRVMGCGEIQGRLPCERFA